MDTTRDIITIDEATCTGCGECVPNCPEGALQIIEGKARLVSDLFCDGLGACIGHCPEGAITIERRPAEPYDERRVMENIIAQGPATIRAHLDHLATHGADTYHAEALAVLEERGIPVPESDAPAEAPLPCGCPGSAVRELAPRDANDVPTTTPSSGGDAVSRLTHWPVQIMLVPPQAPFLAGAELVIAADCVGFALPDFHERLLRGRVLLVGCPKLDDADHYRRKLADLFAANDIRSVTVARMEVPCCGGMTALVRDAIAASGNAVPFAEVVVGVGGNIRPST